MMKLFRTLDCSSLLCCSKFDDECITSDLTVVQLFYKQFIHLCCSADKKPKQPTKIPKYKYMTLYHQEKKMMLPQNQTYSKY